jgi:integrase
MASLIQRPDSPIYYIQFMAGARARRVSTGTTLLQVAKEKLRQFESAQARGEQLPLASKTPTAEMIGAYVRHIRAVKTAKSAQTDIYYLRDLFGPVCDELKITSRKLTAKKRPRKEGEDRRRKIAVLDATYLEQVNTAQISSFISAQVQSRGLAPKTANRYREILSTFFNWAITQRGVRMPGDKNPAAAVLRYKEQAPEIRFQTLKQVDEQLESVAENVQMQAMVAMLIYAGIRREEILWLTHDDLDLSVKPFGVIRIRAKTIEGESWEPKTKKNRAVPVSSRLRFYLDKWQLKSDRGKGVWLFPSPHGMRWDPDNFSSDLRAANDKAKLPWGCLDFRHTFGSQLAMKGESLYKISQLMGNSPDICRRHYAALLPESLVGSVEFADQTPPAQLEANFQKCNRSALVS